MKITEIKGYGWLVWLLPALCYAVMYVVRVAPAVIVSDLEVAYQVSTLEIGILSSGFMLTYITMQIPVGIIADRFGPVAVTIFANLLAILGSYLFCVASTIGYAYVARMIMGVGSACIFVCALKIAKIWLPERYFALVCGLTQVLGMLGAAAGNSLLTRYNIAYGWRNVLETMTLIWLVLTLLIIALLRNKKSERVEPIGTLSDLMTGFSYVISNGNAWLNGIYGGLVFMPMQVLGEWWGPTYLSAIHSITLEDAGNVQGWMFVGLGVSGTFVGYVAERYHCYKQIMVASALTTLVLLSGVLYFRELTTTTLEVVFFLIGFASAGLIIAYAVATDLNDPRFAGSAIAFTNVMSILFGAILQPLVGVIVSYYESYMPEVQAFDRIMVILPISLLIAIYCALRIQIPKKNMTNA
jgi:MFS family permease